MEEEDGNALLPLTGVRAIAASPPATRDESSEKKAPERSGNPTCARN